MHQSSRPEPILVQVRPVLLNNVITNTNGIISHTREPSGKFKLKFASNLTMNWPDGMLEEFKEFTKSKECTRAHNLIELLFETKMPPCYYAGDLTKARFGLLGLNPGYGKGRIKELAALEEYGWEEFYSNFFEIFHHKLKLSSNYYTQSQFCYQVS